MRVRSMSYVQSKQKWVYVDDNLIVGSNKAIDQVTEEIKNVFNVTISPEVTEYFGCKIHVAKNNTWGWIGQPHLYKNLEQKFGSIVKTQRTIETFKYSRIPCHEKYTKCSVCYG